MQDRTNGVVAAALAASLFGSAYVATAFQLHGFTPLGGALWRAGLATVLLLGLAVPDRLRRRVPASGSPRSLPSAGARLARLAVIGVSSGLVFMIGMNLAVSLVGATISSFVAGLYAITGALFAPLVLGERLAVRAVGGFIVALAGTALLAELGPSPGAAAGLAAGGVAAVSFGLGLVLVRRWSRAIGVGPLGIALANSIVTTAGLAIVIGVLDPRLALPTQRSLEVVGSTTWLVAVMAAGPLLTTFALRRIEAALASSMLLLNPITAAILAAILLGDRPSPLQLLGGLLVLAGMAAATDLVGAVRRRRVLSAGGATSHTPTGY